MRIASTENNNVPCLCVITDQTIVEVVTLSSMMQVATLLIALLAVNYNMKVFPCLACVVDIFYYMYLVQK